jgi:uncharacterized protein YfdQ (DUF2303 family)
MSENQVSYPAIHAEIGKEFILNGLPMVIIPEGADLKQFPDLRLAPVRIERTVTVTSASSFMQYFNRFGDIDSMIFVDIEKQRFLGIVDYHMAQYGEGGSEPRHCSHKVVYDCPLTPEAKKWFDNDKKPMDQTQFASFIEDGLLEITEPSGGEMLEIASTLQAKNAVNFRSGIRLDNGQAQMTYEENIQGSAGVTGELKIPQKIAIVLRIFRGDIAGYRIEANFRYRIKEGKLTMWYELIRPHVVREDAVKEIEATIKAGITTGQMIEATV